MTTTLTLGYFTFQDFEVPESIPFGGDQRLAVKKLIGGVRVIDAMGADPIPLEWSGIFFPTADGTQTALDRAQTIQQMKDAGQPINLGWDELYYQVLISKFEPNYQFYRIPYKITCEVLQDLTAPYYPNSAPDADDLINNDLDSANTLTASIGDSTLSGLMGSVTSAIGSIKTFVGASLSSVGSVLQAVHQAVSYVNSAIASTDIILASVGVPAGVLPSVPLLTNIAKFTSISSATNLQVGYLQVSSLLGRMQTNIGLTNSSARTITVSGGNLFDIASKEYGDATAWTQIAQANAILDPTLTGITTLVIPPYNASSGGILSA